MKLPTTIALFALALIASAQDQPYGKCEKDVPHKPHGVCYSQDGLKLCDCILSYPCKYTGQLCALVHYQPDPRLDPEEYCDCTPGG
ncbi:hypothetical protein EJ03DRAFT_327436 [Teratosphaeria nubilosa]|uniref:Uncharacterized protein n=1 Tax=Teratosphaeria nubilosa TaxID=161662 RepID=A0A6G1L9Y1_9PEZI|nr:hypothetical protein EJ03DRAFT_327436 [Teratosphaeria nubilosa]